jgi:hypothetical protein
MKSMYTRFNEALAAVKKAGRTKQYEEASKTFTSTTTIETKLNAAEAVLKNAGVVPTNESTSKVEEFREDSNNFAPGYVKEVKDPCAKGDKVLFDGLLKLGSITEAEHSKLTGKKPEGYDKLSEQQRRDFDFARAVGLSEADAFTLTKMTVSR